MPRDPDLEPGGGLKDVKSKFQLLKSNKKDGEGEWKLDKHAMAYIIRGLNCLIGKFELKLSNGETLDSGEEKSFEFIKELRNGIRDGRDKALPDGPKGPDGSIDVDGNTEVEATPIDEIPSDDTQPQIPASDTDPVITDHPGVKGPKIEREQ